MEQSGAKVTVAYQNERVHQQVQKLVESTSPNMSCIQCDVSEDSQIANAFHTLSQNSTALDILVHSIAFAPQTALKSRFVDISLEDYLQSHHISAYSLISCVKHLLPLLERAKMGSSVITLSFLGSTRVCDSTCKQSSS